MIDLSQDQKDAIAKIYLWYLNNQSPYITLGGYAGTGKSTLIALFRKLLLKKEHKVKAAFCSYTGKGAMVLKSKLTELGVLQKRDFTGTIHSLIYSPLESSNGEIIGWKKKDKIGYNLILIDEASMVDAQIWNDLLSYNVPIIAVGDHGQLPPINSKFNLMEKPKIILEHIHRQAEGNPIIKVSKMAREAGIIPEGKFGDRVEKISIGGYNTWGTVEEILEDYSENTMVLCGYNSTRVKINNFVRTSLGFYEPQPSSGDKVICLRNNHDKGIYNGMTGIIQSIKADSDDWYLADIKMDTGIPDQIQEYEGLIYAPQFNLAQPANFSAERKKTIKGDLFDYGYALTVHKAQGSEAEKVILFEERFSKMDDETWKKWLYTGVTRARNELIIVGS